MNIRKRTSVGVVGYDIDGVNLNEMRQLTELRNRINNVLISHAKDSEKKEYVSDDDLKLMFAVLSVFTKDYTLDNSSAFDDFLKEEAEKENKSESSAPVDNEE